MVALQIRDVPDEVSSELSRLARARGQSVQAYLLALVTREASRTANLTVLQRFSGREDGVVLNPSAISELVETIRDERDDTLAPPPIAAG